MASVLFTARLIIECQWDPFPVNAFDMHFPIKEMINSGFTIPLNYFTIPSKNVQSIRITLVGVLIHPTSLKCTLLLEILSLNYAASLPKCMETKVDNTDQYRFPLSFLV